MNTRIRLVLVAAALAAASVSSALAAPGRATGYPASKVTGHVWNSLLSTTETFSIAPGTSRRAVEQHLGRAAQQLSPDVSVYENCQPDYSRAVAQGCTLLVITFEGAQVRDLKFVNAPMAALIAADLKAHAQDRYAVK